MNIIRVLVRSTLALGIGCGFILRPVEAVAADSNGSIPTVIQAGLDSRAKEGGFDGAIYIWQKGGLMEGDRKVAELTALLRRANQALGNYTFCERLKADSIGQSSQVIYLSMNFQRGAVYARFLLYRTGKSWVVQDMDFNTRPEAIMPWLSLAGGKNTE